MDRKKQKKRGVYLKSQKQKEGLGDYDPAKGKGLKLQWLKFISEYIKNGGNATEAYSSVYVEASRETARRNGSKLLTYTDIIEEIKNRYDEQTVTDSWVIATAKRYVLNGLNNSRVALAGIKALEMIARSRGMLTETSKPFFTAENPAIFLPIVSKEEKEKMDKLVASGQRIFE